MILDDLADVLSSGGVGTVGIDIFKATMPNAPDQLVALFKTGGPAPIHAMAAGPGSAVVERPHVAIWARAARSDAAEKLAQDCWNLLDALGDRTVNGIRYLSVFALQTPFFLQEDETGRRVYACNFEIVREPATSS